MSEKSDTTRRALLRKMGSVAAVGAAFGTLTTESVKARYQKRQQLLNEYRDEDRLRQTFTERAETVKKTLVAEDILPADFDFETESFQTDGSVEHIDPEADFDVTQVGTTRQDGEQTAIVLHSTESDSHRIDFYVQPERDLAYARVRAKDGDETFVADENGVTPSDHCSGYEDCTLEVCDVNYTPGGPTHSFVKNYYGAREDSTGKCEYYTYGTGCDC
ncbi:hypothetical protein [Halorussus pelagicus]|uniref:hypothetical protein n=1 Tax=Halorussus pelagicus TaxID=2505977 RepID=UPI000FFC3785|nr:hypothetical protein [Halorussus pelagicus]